MPRRFLFLALGRIAWGEVGYGAQLADELFALGQPVKFLATPSAAGLLTGKPYPVTLIPSHMGPLLHVVLRDAIEEFRADRLVLSDFVLNSATLGAERVPFQDIFAQIPTIAIDTWNFGESGALMDQTYGAPLLLDHDASSIAGFITPAPIARPQAPFAASFAPILSPSDDAARLRARQALGLGEGERLILFCTAAWQSIRFAPDAAQSLAARTPELFARRIASLGPGVRLLHVGPEEIPQFRVLGDRFRYSPPLGPLFDEVLQAADLLLSANVAGTVVARAIAARLPILMLENSRSIEPTDEVDPVDTEWLRSVGPVHPFRMWPLSMHEFLAPVLKDNPYVTCFAHAELLDAAGFETEARRLLFDATAQDALRTRQSTYLEMLARLPTPAERILASSEAFG